MKEVSNWNSQCCDQLSEELSNGSFRFRPSNILTSPVFVWPRQLSLQCNFLASLSLLLLLLLVLIARIADIAAVAVRLSFS